MGAINYDTIFSNYAGVSLYRFALAVIPNNRGDSSCATPGNIAQEKLGVSNTQAMCKTNIICSTADDTAGYCSFKRIGIVGKDGKLYEMSIPANRTADCTSNPFLDKACNRTRTVRSIDVFSAIKALMLNPMIEDSDPIFLMLEDEDAWRTVATVKWFGANNGYANIEIRVF